MKPNVIKTVGVLLVFMLSAGCVNHPSQQKEGEKVNLVGNDKDDHGCIASAGYQWSELLKDCIRPFEKGIQLKSQTDPNSTLAVYLIFNQDSTQVEVFLPEETNRPVLKRDQSGDQLIWGKSGKLNVQRIQGKWSVFKANRLIYAQ